MPYALLDGARIRYEIIGESGPWVLVVQGGRHPLEELEVLNRAIAAKGFTVLAHDRRNCGRSSLDFDYNKPEEDVWVDDLKALVDHVGIGPALVVARSRGARVALQFARRFPTTTRGLLLWGISGGPPALRFLDNYYYLQYIRACENGGMESVCRLEHFAGLIEANPSNREVLLALDPTRFIEAMTCWRTAFLTGGELPAMGLTEADLKQVMMPTTVVTPFKDKMHSPAAADYVASTSSRRPLPAVQRTAEKQPRW